MPQQTGFFSKFSPKKLPVALGLFEGAKLRIIEGLAYRFEKYSLRAGEKPCKN